VKTLQTFWKHYEGSRAQAVVHRIRGKTPTTA
jgi:hypothetical protein